ncbi:hypothetical protein BJV74DRAFT_798980 [Russula compacta]|nr:hypothetical protein BJV74DRAFT_798980 [Russula compacta]
MSPPPLHLVDMLDGPPLYIHPPSSTSQPSELPVPPLNDTTILDVMFELAVQVTQPVKHLHPPQANGKTKNVRADPIIVGPINLSTHSGWDGFLQEIATLIKCQVDQLVVGSFEWHWLKPANSPWLPLQSKNGLASMFNKLTTCKGPLYVIVWMDPLKVNIQEPALPWASSGIAADPFGDDVLSDSDAPVTKKGKIDYELEKIATKLVNMYSVGLCKSHPTIHCFYHSASNLHFELDCTHRLVWAASIKRGDASYSKIPLGSAHFKVNQALNKKHEEASMPSSSATAMTMPMQMGMGQQFAFNPMAFMGMNSLFEREYNVSHMAEHALPSIATAGPHIPPSSPIIVEYGVDTFCSKYGLDEDATCSLNELGFIVGEDNLEDVAEEDVRKAGFKLLVWQRVLKAYRQFHSDHGK